MTPQARRWIFLAAAAVVAVLLVDGFLGLPRFGRSASVYGQTLDRVEPGERRAADVVTAVVFDYRGVDTLGEEFILFAAVIGVSLLLRELAEERQRAPDEDLPGREVPPPSAAVRLAGFLLAPVTAVFGLSMIVHGHLTPGGGFQGGVIVAAAVLLVYLASDYSAFRRLTPLAAVEVLEATGVGGVVLWGLAGMFAGEPFLANVLPLGARGDLLSAGTIPLLDLTVGVAVACGVLLLVVDFLEQTLTLREGRWYR